MKLVGATRRPRLTRSESGLCGLEPDSRFSDSGARAGLGRGCRAGRGTRPRPPPDSGVAGIPVTLAGVGQIESG